MKVDFVTSEHRFSGDEIARIAHAHSETFQRHRRVLVYSKCRAAYLISLYAAEQANCQLFIAPSSRAAAAIDPHLDSWGVSLVVSDFSDGRLVFDERVTTIAGEGTPGVSIFTSGSTGTPKLAQHSWQTIRESARFVPSRLMGAAWFMAYEPAGYAGLQVYFAARESGRLLVLPDSGSVEQHAKLIADNNVSVMSATPTWWRLLISSWPAAIPKPRLLQATLGGEAVQQSTLNLISDFFSPERLTHIYASTEAGTAIIVSDRLEGFPAKYLDHNGPVELRVRDDVLEIRTLRGMTSYLDNSKLKDEKHHSDQGWYSTGDLVEIRGDRCYFIGRQDGRINIGGTKVHPEEIEGKLSNLDGVLDCVVYARTSPVVGSLLSADVVLSTSADGVSRDSLRKQLTSILPACKVPRHIRIVDSIGVSAYGKKARS